MNDTFEYEKPLLITVNAFLVQGDDKELDDVSTGKFEAAYDEVEHETVELD